MLIIIALLSSSIAAITGILAIGNGRHWKFDVIDYFKGKRNAILYLWVTASTIFSMLHSSQIARFGIVHDWSYPTADTPIWMALHAVMGFLLSVAHFYVTYTLIKEVGPREEFLWGADRSAS